MSGAPVLFDLSGKRVFVTGHAGMVGSAIVRRLERESCDIVFAARRDLDLRHAQDVDRFVAQAQPDAIFVAAGKVGGIGANGAYPADFIADNLAIALNTIDAAHRHAVKKLVYLGSSCIYPRLAPQPMSPQMLLTGPLEPTNQWYAIAKIAGIKMCEAYRLQHGDDFVSVMPTNVYGPGDNYHPQDSHVPAALIRRFHEAKVSNDASVGVWGTGTPRREFLAADDLADACVFVMKSYSDLQFINIGAGEDITIAEFARTIADVVGYRGKIEFDTSRPDGAPRKLLDVSRINALGWRATTPLRDGLTRMYADFQARYGAIREKETQSSH
ncbi:MAG TPA: GDP-L-fucose synthase [Xanthobacteraceae bacterium]|jgi:GDP-L-fucose synthase|nr:GDP-L-fucose synthase [Xanthobacteraceae bacterium]